MRPILHLPDARLRQQATPYENINADTVALANDMLQTMYANNGIGLAAIQVDIKKRLVVMDLSEERNAPKILVNPEIIAHEGLQSSQEGCLSVPDYLDTVERSSYISYCYTDIDGNPVEAEAEGLLAICIQHEIDHLNGTLFIDKLSNLKRQRLQKKFKKLEKARSQQP